MPNRIAGILDVDTNWERIDYFLEKIVPVAEELKVRLACHPHDPYTPDGYKGVTRVLGIGSLGFVAVGTLFAAVAAGTHLRETLLPVLVFPLMVPMVIYGVGAMTPLVSGRPFTEVEGNVRMLGAFALAAVAAGAVLFRYVVED